jgi:beta-galactosidase
LLFPDGSPHPAIQEVRRVFSPIEVVSDAAAARAGTLRLLNRQAFASLEDLTIGVAVVGADGRNGDAFGVDAVATAGETADVALPAEVVRAIAENGALALRLTVRTAADCAWASAGTELAVLEVRVSEAPTLRPAALAQRADSDVRHAEHTVTVDAEGVVEHPVFASGPRLQFWRALTDNDKSIPTLQRLEATGLRDASRRVESVDRITTDGADAVVVTAHYVTLGGDVIAHTQRVTAADGALVFDESVTVPESLSDLPRIGIEFALVPGFEQVTWLGDGPHETYPDRRSSGLLGRWESTVDDLQTPYVRPQENGGRTGVTEATLGDGSRTVVLRFGKGVLFTASHQSVADLEQTAHSFQLPRREQTIVRADIAHRGLGTASVGPEPLPQFLVGPGTYTWSWSLAVR